ncbi:MAG TPA: hypothetical protein VHA12_03585 [Candidatus Nanoarchaeia archaeon]|nr:hypothetical protein [Candidatus Nanoarchaeia archaeon]
MEIILAILVSVHVSNMDLNEIEDEYKRNLDFAEKKFIENIKLGLDIKKIEEDYRKSTEKARVTYNLKLSEFIKTDKSNLIARKSLSAEEKKVFKANTESYDLSLYERIKRKISLLIFKAGFHLRNSFKKNLPSSVLYKYYIFKIKFFRLVEAISDPIKSSISFVFDLFYRVKSKIKELTHTKS